MSGISDAAAITWAIKSNIDSSACMDNQMKMYRKGVSDGKDKDTIIEEDWTTDNTDITIDIDSDDENGIPDGGLGPGFTNLEKGVFWVFSAGDGSDTSDVYVRLWTDPNDVRYYSSAHSQSFGAIHLSKYENGVMTSDRVATYTYYDRLTGASTENYSNNGTLASRSKLTKVRCNTVTNTNSITLNVSLDYESKGYNLITGDVIGTYTYTTGQISFPGYGLSITINGKTNISCTSEIPDFLQTN